MASGYECGGCGESVVCGGEIAGDSSQETVPQERFRDGLRQADQRPEARRIHATARIGTAHVINHDLGRKAAEEAVDVRMGHA